ncbi:MAG TPA: hypothetical protein VNG90_01780 [Candidatus Acidoferrum sp.]|nr:hypothetical protein [Candidatus Acidoferrum sp.]
MNASAYIFVTIIFAVFLASVIISNLASGLVWFVLVLLTKRKVKRL